MSTEKRNSEYINLRCFYIRLLKKLPVLLLLTVLGGVCGFLIYYLATDVFGPGISYETSSTLYIDFAYDPETGTLVDYYNAYTWNTLMGTDAIADNMMSRLEGRDLDKEEVLSCIDADIPSDVRVMVLGVLYPDKKTAEEITLAACASLEDYGRSNPAFDAITILSLDEEASPVVVSDRSIAAVILGCVLFFMGTVVFLMLMEAMNDSIYVPEDAEKRYNLPVLGVISDESAKLPDMFKGELISSMKPFMDYKKIAVISADDRRTGREEAPDPVCAKKAADLLMQIIPPSDGRKLPEFIPDEGLETSGFDGAFLVIRYGCRNRAMTEHIISRLGRSGCPVLGLILSDADPFFLKRYYRV